MKIKNIATYLLFLFFMISCSNSADKERIAYLEEQIVELRAKVLIKQNENTASSNNDENQYKTEISEPSTNGSTYEIVDKSNEKWLIILNEDKTLHIHKSGSDVIHYGSWSGPYSGSIWLIMDYDERPRIVFPNTEEFTVMGAINGDYLYSSVDGAKAKNPNKRLQLKKIK